MTEIADLYDAVRELQSRLDTLYSEVGGWTGALTADQRSQVEYYPTVIKQLEPKMASVR